MLSIEMGKIHLNIVFVPISDISKKINFSFNAVIISKPVTLIFASFNNQMVPVTMQTPILSIEK